MIFVFGNGLSIGFDPRLATAAITDRVVDSLGAPYAGVLRDLAALGAPEDPDSMPLQSEIDGRSWPRGFRVTRDARGHSGL
jgi:hypothetical protein